MTGNILENGVNTFTPVINRLLEITEEFVPYAIFIIIATLGVELILRAVKYIMGYLKNKSDIFYDRRARKLYGYRGKSRRTKEDEDDLDDVIKYGR